MAADCKWLVPLVQHHLPIIFAPFPLNTTVAWREALPRSFPYGVASGTFIHQMRI